MIQMKKNDTRRRAARPECTSTGVPQPASRGLRGVAIVFSVAALILGSMLLGLAGCQMDMDGSLDVSTPTTGVDTGTTISGGGYGGSPVPPATNPVTSVTISPNPAKVAIGKPTILTVVVQPADADNPTLVWESEDDSIVTFVDPADSTVTRIKSGDVIIHATAANGISDSCTIMDK